MSASSHQGALRRAGAIGLIALGAAGVGGPAASAASSAPEAPVSASPSSIAPQRTVHRAFVGSMSASPRRVRATASQVVNVPLVRPSLQAP